MPTLTTLNITVFCFLASYLVALGVEVARLWRPAKWRRNGMLFAGAAGLVAHSLYLIKRSQANGLPPLVGSAHDWLLVLAWLIVAGFLAAALLDRDVSLGVFALPLVLALVLASYVVGRESGGTRSSNWGAVAGRCSTLRAWRSALLRWRGRFSPA